MALDPLSQDFSELVARCLAADESAMVALVERVQSQVFGLCFRMLGNRHDAEDVAQESLARMLRGLHTWDSTRDFSPWLLAIVGNRCRTLLSARRRRPKLAPLPEVASWHDDDSHHERLLAEELQLALRHLRPEYRQAFELFHYEELGYLQIAAALGCPVGTAKTWVHRARRELIARFRERGTVEESRHVMRKV